MAIAALSFRVFSSFLLLARVGNENAVFEHEGNHQNSHFSSTNNRNLLEMRKDMTAIAINSVPTTTYQGTGKLFGADYSSIYTGVATPHGGTLIAEFNGICTTKDGDTVGVWAHGRGRPTGSGLKASWRGGVIWQASSPKFARLNSLPGVWELDIDEGGNFRLKVWEWK
jgi:hypothetical protein